MDEIDKVLRKLSAKERQQIKTVLGKLATNVLIGLDIKKLKGHSNIFRVRSSSLRVIFRRDENGKVFVLTISRRNEGTYKDF